MILIMLRSLLYGFALWIACSAKVYTLDVSDSAEVVVEQGTILEDLLGDMGFEEFVSMDITASEELRNQGVAPGDIRDVFLVSFSLSAVSPSGADLSFMERMDIYVEAPGLSRALVASADAFPEGQARVDFEMQNLDLTPYAVSQSMTFSTDVTAHRPDADTTVRADFAVEVGFTGQGACAQAKAARDAD